MEREKRVTFTLTPEQKALLAKVAEALGKRQGDVAKEIVVDVLGAMQEIFGLEEGQATVSSDRALRRMYRISLGKLLEATEQMDTVNK